MPAHNLERSLNQLLNRIVLRMTEALVALYGILLILRLAGLMIPEMGRSQVIIFNTATLSLLFTLAFVMRRTLHRAGVHEWSWSALMVLMSIQGVMGIWIEPERMRLAGMLSLFPITGIFIQRRRLLFATYGILLAVCALGLAKLGPALPKPGFFLSSLIVVICFGTYLHLMTRILLRRVLTLFDRLQRARGEIQELTEFLPICAWCKHARDDQGYWQQVEAYLEKRSKISFTHGLCPNCYQKMKAEIPFGPADEAISPPK